MNGDLHLHTLMFTLIHIWLKSSHVFVFTSTRISNLNAYNYKYTKLYKYKVRAGANFFLAQSHKAYQSFINENHLA